MKNCTFSLLFFRDSLRFQGEDSQNIMLKQNESYLFNNQKLRRHFSIIGCMKIIIGLIYVSKFVVMER
jgi:hypothetical protein